MWKFYERLTFANVVSVIALFVALGGTGLAASQIGKNSVGTKQLKKNAVTNAKIKKNAVTKAKIKKNAVTTAKIKKNAVVEAKIGGEAVTTRNLRNGSVTGAKIDAPSTLFPRIVRWNNGYTVPISGRHLVPLPEGSFLQNAEELITFASTLSVHFGPKCAPPRSVEAFLLVDAAEPLALRNEDIAAAGKIVNTGGGDYVTQIALSPSPEYNKAILLQPGADTPHVLYMVAEGKCATGDEVSGWSHFDVIGVKARV
jgi:hypothetical protein